MASDHVVVDPFDRKAIADRLRHASKVLFDLEADGREVYIFKTKDGAEASAELMRLAELAADLLDPKKRGER